MIERLVEEHLEVETSLVAGTPKSRSGKPEEIAEVAVWLCSDRASIVTGHNMLVDGAFSTQ